MLVRRPKGLPNRQPPAILLRESYCRYCRVGSALCNLADWPNVEGLSRVLKSGRHPRRATAIRIERSLPHGHVAAALGTARKIGLDVLLGPEENRRRDLMLALVVRGQKPMSPMPPPGALAGAGFSATIASVVISNDATDAACWRAVRTTLVGSIMPDFTRSLNSPPCASKP